MEKLQSSLLFLAAMACVLMEQTNSMSHIVGGSFGWSIPKNSSFYQEWAKPRTFGVGDKLVFPYRTGVHNVLEVDEKEYKACTQENPIDMLYKGPTILELKKKGSYYFYCGVGTHCEAGQKLAVTVTIDGSGSSGAPFNPVFEPAPAPALNSTKSSANSIHNLGLVSGLVYLLVSMFI
ncbi:mavicyanin-like [Macadamia integrifolia]|uniref:mavicyanin-like n=1 Tax=Macadamia integrifolia TaxID=60698 RepID=UPI001C4F5D8D|nr:mavicyanin-like [Macadamia integrifolia]